MMYSDMTFCNAECDNIMCIRHKDHIPKNTPVSVADMGGDNCDYIPMDPTWFFTKEE